MKSVRNFVVPAVALITAIHAHAAPVSSLAASGVAVGASGPSPSAVAAAISAAQPVDPVESDGARLAMLQKRIPVLQAEKQIAELEKAIRDANTSSAAGGMPGGVPPGLGGPSNANRAPAPTAELGSGSVEVRGIDSYNGKFSATLVAGGRVDDVRVGDSFAGWRVARISAADVTLTRTRGGRVETRIVRY